VLCRWDISGAKKPIAPRQQSPEQIVAAIAGFSHLAAPFIQHPEIVQEFNIAHKLNVKFLIAFASSRPGRTYFSFDHADGRFPTPV
jgi:hypothetical protein